MIQQDEEFFSFAKKVRENFDKYLLQLSKLNVPCGQETMKLLTIIKETPPVTLYNYNLNYSLSYFAIFKCEKCFSIKKVCLADIQI